MTDAQLGSIIAVSFVIIFVVLVMAGTGMLGGREELRALRDENRHLREELRRMLEQMGKKL